MGIILKMGGYLARVASSKQEQLIHLNAILVVYWFGGTNLSLVLAILVDCTSMQGFYC